MKAISKYLRVRLATLIYDTAGKEWIRELPPWAFRLWIKLRKGTGAPFVLYFGPILTPTYIRPVARREFYRTDRCGTWWCLTYRKPMPTMRDIREIILANPLRDAVENHFTFIDEKATPD